MSLKFKQLGLIGCGLMGASFALALQKHKLVEKVVGFSPSARTRERALQLGVIQQAATSAAEAVQGCDIVLLAVPVSRTAECLQAMAPFLSPDCLLMDVGSTKTDVVAAAAAHLDQRLLCFVPAHPIAGKVQAGVDHAEAELYQHRRAILTPLAQTGAVQLENAKQVWAAIGSHVSLMTPQDHDAMFAAVSHVPHLLAFAMMHSLQAQAEGEQFMALAGSGFRDFTRIASSSPEMWRDICVANRTAILAELKRYQGQLALRHPPTCSHTSVQHLSTRFH